MEVDQSVLDALPQEQRQNLARRMRQEQIRRYHEREKALNVQPKSQGEKERRTGNKKVKFGAKDRLQDAAQRRDHDEGRSSVVPFIPS